jgi:hypothetical protein
LSYTSDVFKSFDRRHSCFKGHTACCTDWAVKTLSEELQGCKLNVNDVVSVASL